MREFLSFKALENKISRKQRTKYLRKTIKRIPKTKKLNACIKAIQAVSSFFILMIMLLVLYYEPFDFGWIGLVVLFLVNIAICKIGSNFAIKKVIAMYYGYQSLSLLYDKIVIKEIQRWVMNNSVPTKRLTNIYLPHVQTLLEEHKKASLIERFKSQWGKIFLLPSALFFVFSFIYKLPGAENASSGEILYAYILVLIIGVIILVFTVPVPVALLSFYTPDFDRRFYARLELALTIAAYR